MRFSRIFLLSRFLSGAELPQSTFVQAHPPSRRPIVASSLIPPSAARTAPARTRQTSPAAPAPLGSAPARRGCEQRTHLDLEDGRVRDLGVLRSGHRSCVPVAGPAPQLPLDEGALP